MTLTFQSSSGAIVHECPYKGNPPDILRLRRQYYVRVGVQEGRAWYREARVEDVKSAGKTEAVR